MEQRSAASDPGRRPRRHLWAAGLAVVLLLLGGGVTALVSIPPVYEVWFGGQLIGAGRDLNTLEQALRAEVQRRLDRTLTLASDEQAWTYSASELGMQLDPDTLAADLTAAAAGIGWWGNMPHQRVLLSLNQEPAWNHAQLQHALAPIRAALTRAPVPAELHIADRKPVITPEVVGASVELEPVLAGLRSLGEATHMEIPITHQVPPVTAASLEAMRIKRLLVEWTTAYDPTIPRGENVQRAALAFNGLILKPGEILSYNETVGPISLDTGWQPAPVFVNGQVVPGVGGGVCQVASTFYGAALRANLDIVERHPHQLPVAYIDPSQDAAIAQGWEDLKLRNTTLGHLLIETEAEGGRVTFRLYGDLPENQSVRIESSVLGDRPFDVREVVDTSLPPGAREVRTWGSPGLVSEAYRLVYEDGKLIRREKLSRDSYLPTHHVVAVGPAPADN